MIHLVTTVGICPIIFRSLTDHTYLSTHLEECYGITEEGIGI